MRTKHTFLLEIQILANVIYMHCPLVWGVRTEKQSRIVRWCDDYYTISYHTAPCNPMSQVSMQKRSEQIYTMQSQMTGQMAVWLTKKYNWYEGKTAHWNMVINHYLFTKILMIPYNLFVHM